MKLRIAFCWSNISGYVAACLRELTAREDVEVKAFFLELNDTGNVAFDLSIAGGIDVCWIKKQDGETEVREVLTEFDPNVLIVSGWNNPLYRSVVLSSEFDEATKIIAIDNQRKPGVRQLAGRLAYAKLLKKFNGIMVPGERSWQFARYLGFTEGQIIRGTYGIDFPLFNQASKFRKHSTKSRKGFVFIGRYVEVKGIGILIKAYKIYRERVDDPWTLTLCGKGPLGNLLANEEGVNDLGFVQPGKMPSVLAEHGAFVLPSIVEPWGQVIVEAAAAGLPVICTEACGASVELVQNEFNGMKVPTGSVEDFANALEWIHSNQSRLSEMGRRSVGMAEAYSAENWTNRLLWWLRNSR